MAVTKTDWSKPASDPVNRGQSAEAARYQAMADYYRPGGQGQPLASGAVYAGGSPAQRMSDISVPGPRTEEDQIIYDAAIERALQSLAAQEEAARVAAVQQMRAQEAATAMGLAQRQAGYDAYKARTQAGIDQLRRQMAARSGLGMPSPMGIGLDAFGGYMRDKMMGQLEDAMSRERYLSDRRLVEPVYGPTGQLTGVRDEYGRLTGRDPVADAEEEERRRLYGDSAPEVTAPIQDPVTGQQRCPDGYIFDEDLNACRLAPMDVTATTATPGEAYARTGLLDVAPEGLLDFQKRYGAGFGTPMDFEAANLAFRRQGATYPEYFRTAPKLDGYTLLS